MSKKISLIISSTILLANASVNSSNMDIVKDRDISKLSQNVSDYHVLNQQNMVGTSTYDQQPLTTLYQFSGSDGKNPMASLMTINNDGVFYGTTSYGDNYGTIFKINSNTGELSILHGFSNINEGEYPASTLTTFNNDGFLYGTTSLGGNFSSDCFDSGCGIIFKIDPTSGKLSTLYKFSGPDGASPSVEYQL